MPERTQKWDILRFAMIFLVVLGHFADCYTGISEQMRSLYVFIYSFHMPIFIFVSGLFSKKTVNEKRKDKIFGYLVIYLLLKLLAFLYRIIAGWDPEISIFSEGSVPWFMLALFAFTLITSWVKDFSPVFVMVFSVLLACAAGYDKEIGTFLSLSRIIVYFPFFYAGYILDRKKLEDFCKGKIKKIISLVIIVSLGVTVFSLGDKMYWLRPLLTGANSFYALGDYAKYGFWIRLLYYAIVVVICTAIIIITPNKTPLGIAAKAGQRTLSVYCLHYAFVHFMYNVFGCGKIFADIFGENSQWIIIPISLAVTLILSAKPLNDLFLMLATVPKKKIK